MSSWLTRFPTLGEAELRALKQNIDHAFRSFTREHGELIENLFEPLKAMLIFSEKMFLAAPWPLMLLILAGIAWFASRSVKVVIMTVVTLSLIGVFGMWDNTMKTLSMILISTLCALAIGLPVGIAMSRSDVLQRLIMPVLDIMQTMPSFVYLIPVVMLLGIGKVPGMIAIVIYAVPPAIRFTNLGIRLVDPALLEAADAFGTPSWRRLFRIQLPLALPTIMGGVNQTVMMALAMVVIAAMIGVTGLGQPVLKSITNQYFTLGVFNGLAIVGIAIMIDRVTQTYGRRLQKHMEVGHD